MRGALIIAGLALGGCGRLAFDPAGVDAANAAKTTYRDVVMADGPIGYWRLGDLGAVMRDETGSFDGTVAGTCTRGVAGALAGDSNGALSFDGSTCNVSLGDVLGFPGNAPFSVEVWIYDRLADQYQTFFMKETRISGGPLDGYAMLNAPQGMYLERIVNTAGNVTLPVSIPAFRWLHLVAIYDGGNVAMFIDAAQVGPTRQTTDVMPVVNANASIGMLPPNGAPYKGDMDELAIYDHALSPDRIALHHDVGVNGPR